MRNILQECLQAKEKRKTKKEYSLSILPKKKDYKALEKQCKKNIQTA